MYGDTVIYVFHIKYSRWAGSKYSTFVTSENQVLPLVKM
jgi:hypothetical protein